MTKAPSLRVIFLSLTNQTDNDHQEIVAGRLMRICMRTRLEWIDCNGRGRDCYRFTTLAFFIVLFAFYVPLSLSYIIIDYLCALISDWAFGLITWLSGIDCPRFVRVYSLTEIICWNQKWGFEFCRYLNRFVINWIDFLLHSNGSFSSLCCGI